MSSNEVTIVKENRYWYWAILFFGVATVGGLHAYNPKQAPIAAFLLFWPFLIAFLQGVRSTGLSGLKMSVVLLLMCIPLLSLGSPLITFTASAITCHLLIVRLLMRFLLVAKFVGCYRLARWFIAPTVFVVTLVFCEIRIHHFIRQNANQRN